MRKSYADYGMTDERARGLLRECRAGGHGAQVRRAAYKANPLIAEYIIHSIMQNKAFDVLEYDSRLGRIPCGRTDFYGYRRYTLAILNNMLEGKETE